MKTTAQNPVVLITGALAGIGRATAVHNHPSRDPSPSEADLWLTRRILETSKILRELLKR